MRAHAGDNGNHHGGLRERSFGIAVFFVRSVAMRAVFVPVRPPMHERRDAEPDGNRRHPRQPRIFEGMRDDVEQDEPDDGDDDKSVEKRQPRRPFLDLRAERHAGKKRKNTENELDHYCLKSISAVAAPVTFCNLTSAAR